MLWALEGAQQAKWSEPDQCIGLSYFSWIIYFVTSASKRQVWSAMSCFKKNACLYWKFSLTLTDQGHYNILIINDPHQRVQPATSQSNKHSQYFCCSALFYSPRLSPAPRVISEVVLHNQERIAENAELGHLNPRHSLRYTEGNWF